jgi:DNA-directed RNA polymerase subunit RPC12/RpoP
MSYVVVVMHETKGEQRIPVDVKDRGNAVNQAQMRNQGSGYNWDGATVEEVPEGQSKIPFKCMKCGGTTFRTPVAETKDIEELIGAPCASCGTKLTEDDIKAQALKIAEEAARKAFGQAGLKIRL